MNHIELVVYEKKFPWLILVKKDYVWGTIGLKWKYLIKGSEDNGLFLELTTTGGSDYPLPFQVKSKRWLAWIDENVWIDESWSDYGNQISIQETSLDVILHLLPEKVRDDVLYNLDLFS